MAAPSQLVGQTLGHYRIIEQIGAGGMGVVYRARDEQLEREVAVKVLPAGTLADEAARKRFRKEALALARLNHPNIETVYEFSRQDGVDFLAMELIPGVALDAKLASGALPEPEVLRLGVQMAAGLEAAHRQGIVHRDLKPGNLRLNSDGQLKILDFGLAQLVQPEGERGLAATLTESQQVTGTLPYMAPEQLRGSVADARSDIWAAGAVLYEMATAHRPFEAKLPSALAADIIHETPLAPRKVRSELSPKLEAIILKCLEKEPAKRYQSASEVQADLERLSTGASPVAFRQRLWPMVAAAAVALALLAAGGAFYLRRSPKLTEKDNIVLADFDNHTGDSVFDGTLKQALAIDLEQSPFLNVLSDEKVSGTLRLMGRSSSERVTQELAREICVRTGSNTVLRGSIATLGSHYAIALQAANCQTGDSRGGSQAEAEGRERVLQALGIAATKLRGTLGESLASIKRYDKPLEEATTSSLEALKAYTEARRIASAKSYAEAIPFYKRAVELDPNFARAYASLGVTYYALNQHDRGVENLKRAYELQDRVSDREKFYISSEYQAVVTGELEKATPLHELWTQEYPRDDIAHLNLGATYMSLGQYEKAAGETRESLRIEPNNAMAYANLGSCYLAGNRLDEAKATFDEALARKVDSSQLRVYMYYWAFLQKDTSAMERQLNLAIGNPESEGSLLSIHSDTEVYYGRLENARQFSERAVESAKRNGAAETAALWEANEAEREPELGNLAQARHAATAALALSRGRDVRVGVTLALALAGDVAAARKLSEALNREFPLDTIIQRYWLPTIYASIEVAQGNTGHAIEILKAASPYELSWAGPMYPAYVRGHAYLRARNGAAAAAEFQKILDHPGVVLNFPTGALAHLQLGRAYVLSGDTAKARTAYQEFLTLWKDADPDIPIVKQAKAEYAKLQ